MPRKIFLMGARYCTVVPPFAVWSGHSSPVPYRLCDLGLVAVAVAGTGKNGSELTEMKRQTERQTDQQQQQAAGGIAGGISGGVASGIAVSLSLPPPPRYSRTQPVQ